MSRGTTIKQETTQKLTLLRPMITRRYELVADHEACCGCKTCATTCPVEAITVSEAVLENGRVVAKPRVDIDPAKCNFCGACVVMCPTHALFLTVNGEPELPVLKGEAFPDLIRANVVEVPACRATSDTSYAENCPVKAIHVRAERGADGQSIVVTDVTVDEEDCVHCTRCMEEGPLGAFTVTKPYKGRTFLNTLLCPAGCQACADICPTHAITYDGEKVALDPRFCLFCTACENVCPAEGAVRIVRTGYLHTPVESGAWAVALGKLVSVLEVARELDIKGQEKRRNLVLSGLLLQDVPKKEK